MSRFEALEVERHTQRSVADNGNKLLKCTKGEKVAKKMMNEGGGGEQHLAVEKLPSSFHFADRQYAKETYHSVLLHSAIMYAHIN